MSKKFGFTYIFCTDLPKMKMFYHDLLRLDLIYEEENMIAFKIGEHQLSIQEHKGFSPNKEEFSIQPGWKGGTLPAVSWSIEYDAAEFNEVVMRMKENHVTSFYPEPKWSGYWSFPVLDDMNHTVEITCIEEDGYTDGTSSLTE